MRLILSKVFKMQRPFPIFCCLQSHVEALRANVWWILQSECLPSVHIFLAKYTGDSKLCINYYKGICHYLWVMLLSIPSKYLGFFSGFNCKNNNVRSLHNNLVYIIILFGFFIILIAIDFSLSPKFIHLLKHIVRLGLMLHHWALRWSETTHSES